MKDEKVTKTRAYGLRPYSTVFQAELQAIRLSCIHIREVVPQGEQITIMSDSQAAIKAQENPDTSSKLVRQTKVALNNLGKDYQINIQWIKAHVNNKGNEIADQLAKTGTKL